MIEFGRTLVSIEQDISSVHVKIAKVADDQTPQETCSFEYVVGADGARSKILLV